MPPAGCRNGTGDRSRPRPSREVARSSPPRPLRRPSRPRRDPLRTGSAPDDSSGYLFERLGNRGHDVLGKRDVAELLAELLSIAQAVADHRLERVTDLGVWILLVEEQPGVGDDR